MSDEQNLPTNTGADNNNAPVQDTPPADHTPNPTSPTPPVPPATDPTTTDNDDNQGFSELQKELEDTKSKLTELTQISQQALADLQNYKKRTEEEKIKFVAFANSGLITDLLPILDNIERAGNHIPEDPAAKEWANGMLIVFKTLTETLSARGLEIIPTENQNFDPNLHEAVMTENGTQDRILRELEKGYRINDRVLRRSKVIVGNGQEELKTENPPTPQ